MVKFLNEENVLLLTLQHYLTMIGAIVSIPFILTPALCMKDDDPARSHIICTMIFVTGLVTWVQATFGCRYCTSAMQYTVLLLNCTVKAKPIDKSFGVSVQYGSYRIFQCIRHILLTLKIKLKNGVRLIILSNSLVVSNP